MNTARGPLKLGVLISGGGTTLENICRCIERGQLNAAVQVVISTSPKAYGLVRARNHAIASNVIRPRDYSDVHRFSAAVTDCLDQHQVDLVLLAGFLSLWILPEQYYGRVMNIHPALIPAFCGHGFYGHRVHEAVLGRGTKVSGCTVHFASNEYDAGPIIVQKCVPVLEDDTPETLAARVFEQECKAYPEAIRLFAEGRLKIEGKRTRILPKGV